MFPANGGAWNGTLQGAARGPASLQRPQQHPQQQWFEPWQHHEQHMGSSQARGSQSRGNEGATAMWVGPGVTEGSFAGRMGDPVAGYDAMSYAGPLHARGGGPAFNPHRQACSFGTGDRSGAGGSYAFGYQGDAAGGGGVYSGAHGGGGAMDRRSSQGPTHGGFSQAQGFAPHQHAPGTQLGSQAHVNSAAGSQPQEHLQQQPALRPPLTYRQEDRSQQTPLQHQLHCHPAADMGAGAADGWRDGGGLAHSQAQPKRLLGLHGSQSSGGQRSYDDGAFSQPHMMPQQHARHQAFSQVGTQHSDLLHQSQAAPYMQQQPPYQQQQQVQRPPPQPQQQLRQTSLSQFMQPHGPTHSADGGPIGGFGTISGLGDGGGPSVARLRVPLAAPEPENTDRLVPVRDLPPALQPLFPSFRYFNSVQSECFPQAYGSDVNMVVSAPTGSGKTGVMELALLRLLSGFLEPGGERLRPLRGTAKAVYVAPLRALVQEKCKDWQARFGALLGLSVLELSGDAEPEASALEAADLLCTTPEKLDALSRKLSEQHRSAAFLSDISLVLIDEVHLLNEAERGSALEAGVVSRFAMLATFPQLQQHAVSRLRFVAVSATIPNVRDIATWLRVPPAGLKVYGEEMRPVKLRTVVLAYAPSKNDFLFERRLDTYLAGVVAEHSRGKPTLVFCSSRKGTIESAMHLAKEAGPGGRAAYVRDAAHAARLAAAARQVAANKQLQICLVAGVGFHNAAMEGDQRELVEGLFLAGDLPVLCSTSTLALGVNLPAHLVIIKGTRRYCGADGGGGGQGDEAAGSIGGYKEYDRSVCLQMVGRAGRPQFDTEGVAVIMTQKETRDRYTNLLSGSEAVESCLHQCFAEHLNAEVVLGTVRDMATATQWLRTTFLHVRVRQAPRAYGLEPPPGALSSDAAFDAWLAGRLVGGAVTRLAAIGLVSQDPGTGVLAALEPGRIMAHAYLRLGTMSAITQVGSHAGMMALLRVIAVAEEFAHIRLRRGEKKVLNDINKRVAGDAPIKFPVPADAPAAGAGGVAARPGPPKPKDRISKATEKIFIMVNEALSDAVTDTLDYSMRQELEGVLRVGQRIAAAMVRYFTHRQSLAATANALCLAKSLKQRMWDDSKQVARQLPDIGRLLAHRLAGAGVVGLRQLAGVDPRRIEAVTQKAYPFGNNVRVHLAKLLPPEVAITLQAVPPGPHQKAGGSRQGVQIEVTLARPQPEAGPAGAAAPVAPATRTSAVLLVGSSSDDRLLRHERLTIETFTSPYTFQVTVNPSSGRAQHHHAPLQVLAVLVVERLCGLDVHTSLKLAPDASGASKVLGSAAAAAGLPMGGGEAEAADGGMQAAGAYGGGGGGGAYGDAALQPSPLPHGLGVDGCNSAEGPCEDGVQAMPVSSQQRAPRAGGGRAAEQPGGQGRGGHASAAGPPAARPQVLVQAPALAAPAFAQLADPTAAATMPLPQLQSTPTPPVASPAPQSLQVRTAAAGGTDAVAGAGRGRGSASAAKLVGGQTVGLRGGAGGSRPGGGGLAMSGSALAGAKQVPAFARLLALAKSRSSSVGAALAGAGAGGEGDQDDQDEDEEDNDEEGHDDRPAGQAGGCAWDTPGAMHGGVGEPTLLVQQPQDQCLDLFDFLSDPPEEQHASAAAAVTPPPSCSFAAGFAAASAQASASRPQPSAAPPAAPQLPPSAMRGAGLLLPARGGLSSRPVSASSGAAAAHTGSAVSPAPTPASGDSAARPLGASAAASDMPLSDRKRLMLGGTRDRTTLDGLMLMQQRQRKAAAMAAGAPIASAVPGSGGAGSAASLASSRQVQSAASPRPPPHRTAPIPQTVHAVGQSQQSHVLQNQQAMRQGSWDAAGMRDEERALGPSAGAAAGSGAVAGAGAGACWDQFVDQHDARSDVTQQRRQQDSGWGQPKLPRRSYGKIAVAGGGGLVGSAGNNGTTSYGYGTAADYGIAPGQSFSLDKALGGPPAAAAAANTGGATSVTGVATASARPTAQRACARDMVGPVPLASEAPTLVRPESMAPPPRAQPHAHVPDFKPLVALTQGLRKRQRQADTTTPVDVGGTGTATMAAAVHALGTTASGHDDDVDPTQDWFSQLQF